MLHRRIGYKIPALIVLIVLAYARTIRYDFIADDIAGIVNNNNIGNLHYVLSHYSGIAWALVRHINYIMGGFDPVHYHITNILLHVINAILVYVLIFLISGKRVAFYVALLFAVHPIATEVVTWISGGSYALYTAFLLASFITYIMARTRKSAVWYGVSLCLFVGGIVTSEKMLVLVPILFIYSFSQGRLKKDFLHLLPYVAGGIGLILIYVPFVAYRLTMYKQVFALSSEVSNPYILIPVSFSTYLQLLFWPTGLTLYHVEPITTFGYMASFFVTALYIGALYISYKANKHIFFWLCFFVISLLPVLTPLRISSFVAERYVYLGAIGMYWLVAYSFTVAERKYIAGKTAFVVVSIIIAALFIRTVDRNSDWKDESTFWTKTVESSPHSYQAHYNLGTLYMERKELNAAIQELLIAIELKSNYDLGYQSLGYAYQLNGMNDKALASYNMAVMLNPSLWPSYKNMGAIYLQQEDYAKAEEMAQKSILLDKHNADLYTNLGIIYLKQSKKEQAKKAFETALQLDPMYERARYGLSLTK
ncbi:MAG: hypothetical protein RI947_24 [Candidatus Parcubacteria bacterium]|jgi:tetratricopeptide (TPR) repeat protein